LSPNSKQRKTKEKFKQAKAQPLALDNALLSPKQNTGNLEDLEVEDFEVELKKLEESENM